MLGSAVFRTGVAPGGALAGPWVKNELWNKARSVPSLDLRFADNKSLVDATTGQNLVTFTRASSGTYVDSQGVIRNATTNLLLRSEEFNDAGWSAASTPVGITPNTQISPTGQLTADTLSNTANTSSEYRIVQFISSSAQLCFSVYVKKGTHSFIQLRTNSASSGHVNFDLDLVSASASTATGSIVDVGSDWRRCIAVFPAASITSVQIQLISSLSAVRAETWTPAGTISVHLWGAQLEQSNTVGEYIPTTSTINSAPRFDHNPTTGESLGLLVEEQRTNLLVRSEEFNDANWTKANTTVTSNQTTAPDGSANADLIAGNAGTALKYIYQTYPASTNGVFTFSIFAKAGTESFIVVRITDQGGVNEVRQRFDLSSGVVSGSVVVGGTATAGSSSINPVGNGWYRCVVTATFAAFTQLQTNVWLNSYAAVSLTTNFYLWGAQLEAGAFPTSYIPTTTATVTRSADVASITGSNFSSWYRQDEGTVFVERIQAATDTANARRFLNISDGTNSNAIQLYQPGGGQFAAVSYISGVSDFAPTAPGAPAAGAVTKGSLAFSSTGKSISRDGGSIATSAVSPPVSGLTTLFIGGQNASNLMTCSPIRRLTYWPQRLPNETLQGITQ